MSRRSRIATSTAHPKVIGIGEAGLDYFYDKAPRDDQMAGFRRHIEAARLSGLPLVIHTREAWDDTFDVLDSCGTPRRTIFHCFTGGETEARKCVERGAYLSFSGIVTFKTADDVREAARWCPIDHVLIETDAPFLAPVPHRGKPNQPSLVGVVGTFVADLRGMDVGEFARATTRNANLAFPGIAP